MTDKEKQEASEHVHYEAKMLRSVVDVLRTQRIDKGCPEEIRITLKNALIESFCIHLRNLMNFLYSKRTKGTKPDDVLAEDFFELSKPWQVTKPKDFDTLKKRANGEVFHLTSRRFMDPLKKQWEFAKDFQAIHPAIEQFQRQAPKPLLAKCWTEESIDQLPELPLDAAKSLGPNSSASGATQAAGIWNSNQQGGSTPGGP